MQTRLFLMLLLFALFLAGCAAEPVADFDIRGEWDYTMINTDGNVYDVGTITFSGKPTQGTYLELNIYEVEYTGEFLVKGNMLKLTGDETWDGTVTDVTTMTGNWSHTDGASGTFTATRN